MFLPFQANILIGCQLQVAYFQVWSSIFQRWVLNNSNLNLQKKKSFALFMMISWPTALSIAKLHYHMGHLNIRVVLTPCLSENFSFPRWWPANAGRHLSIWQKAKNMFTLIPYLPNCNIKYLKFQQWKKLERENALVLWHSLTPTFTFNFCSKTEGKKERERGRKPGHVNSRRLRMYVVSHLFFTHTCTLR